ncbi:MAG: PAS domain S-box protein [Verrucomicrobia bacterium]|nr:PAS domain S-box protein [Verrucomicrobiota bacterium]
MRTAQKSPPDHRSQGVAAAVFVIVALVLIVAGYLYYRSETAEITRDKCQTLASISELKSRQIAQWRYSILSEARRAAGDPDLVATLEECIRAPGDEGLRSKLAERLRKEVFDEEDHSGSLIFDAGSNVVVSNDDDGSVLTEATRVAMRDALATGQVGFSDFYIGSTGAVHLDAVAPVKDKTGNLLGGVILRHEAEDFLFPLVQSWPVPTSSAETILVEHDGNDALFVTDKGHKPLTRRVPLTQTDAPTVQMVLGKRGIFEGRDYRGVEVVGDLAAIPGSPWFLEVKEDSEEIFSEARDRATLISLVVGLLVLVSGGLIMVFYRNRQAGILKGLLNAERERAEALEEAQGVESRHRDIIQTATDGFCMVDSKARILEVNDAFCKMLGYSEQELLAMNISDLEADMSPEIIAANIQKISALGQYRFETRHRRKDGRVFDVEVSIQHRPSDGLMVAFHHDITARRRMVENLKQSEAKFREVIASSPVAMAGLDARMNSTFLNPEFVRLLGYTQEDLPTISQWWLKAYPDPEYRKSVADSWTADIERAKRTGEAALPFEVIVRCKDGTDKNVLISTPVSSTPFDERYVVSLLDITGRMEAEKQLQEAEKIAREKTALLKSIIESPQSIVIFALDRYYRYTEFTTAHRETIKKIWGVEIEIGMNMLDVIRNPADREKAKRNFDYVLQGEWLLAIEEYGDPPNRSFYENRYSPVLDATGKVVGLTVFVIDVSERRRAEEKLVRSEQLLRESQETANIGHYINDLATGLWESSPVMDRIFGIGLDFVRDADGWGSLIHPDDREKTVAYLLDVLAGRKPFRMDYRIIRPLDGEVRWMAGYGDFEYDESGKALRLVGCIQDITERKLAEEELKKTNDELNRSLHTAKELAVKAEAATRAKSEFLAVMSHELRTPLNGVLGFTEILAMTPLDSEQQDFVRIVRDSGEHLLGIVNDILDFSSIEKDRMVFESGPVVVSEVVKASAAAVQKTAADKGLEFRCETAPGVPEQITGDARRIRQVLINLLGNAVKFTSKGSVFLRVAPGTEGKPKHLEFSIEDTGPGIASETLGSLFKPFTQADSSLHRSFDGAGLGLAISQRLAEAMGGEIRVVSTPGKGSTFTFRLPVDSQTLPARSPADQQQPPATPAPGGLVLVVEDDAMNSLLAGKILESLGVQVEFASNGLDAVNAFAPGKYSAIFMDVQMPVMNGLEATEKIRGIEAVGGIRVPIIALTANVLPSDLEQCLAAGMDSSVTKPYSRGQIAAELARLSPG